jgi:protoheme IX farnesyltransferase
VTEDKPRLDAAGFAGLIRPRIAVLVLVITAAGYVLEKPSDYGALPWALLGTLLVAGAGCALNHFLERKTDALMPRTAGRPLCTGAMTEGQVSWGGGIVMAVGFAVLYWGAGRQATLWQLLAIVTYLVIYTPLKKRTSVNTWVGALPGALPVIVGAAAAGGPTVLSWIVFTLVFLWQLPHFFAIASMYREDYMSGGLRMLSGDDPGDVMLRWQMPIQVMSVMLVSVIPVHLGVAGAEYGLAALAAGLVFFVAALAFRKRPDRARARQVVVASVVYLPAVMAALILDVACQDTTVSAESLVDGELNEELACDECLVPVVASSDGGALCPDCDVDVPEGATADHDQHASARETDLDGDEEDGGGDLASSLAGLLSHTPEPIADGTGLPNFGALPEFALLDDGAKPFGKNELLGSAWVVDFIFTHCAGPCPVMSQLFADLSKEGLPTRFLSITVDPQRDSPQVLAEYRARHKGSAETWRLLTGAHAAIQSLAEAGFRLPVNAGVEPVAGMPPMFHSGKFALVDKAGNVRGYYNYNDRLALEQMRQDIVLLSEAAQ